MEWVDDVLALASGMDMGVCITECTMEDITLWWGSGTGRMVTTASVEKDEEYVSGMSGTAENISISDIIGASEIIGISSTTGVEEGICMGGTGSDRGAGAMLETAAGISLCCE
jgi:predicted DNA-binding protein with PD1-like motif